MDIYTSKPNRNWVRRSSIGRGSFGVVSLAVGQLDSNLVFAVKSVQNNSGDFLRCLENEIRILKSLSSPYVVKYLGDDLTCESPSVVYRNLHMEYMPGGTVADVAKHGDGVKNLRNYTRCITSALSYIHARNVVHCDVKGKNVLIGDTPGTAKLADFGSAIELGVPVQGTRGSPLWMAPEVIRGEYQGPESDVWSLGCTVIEILTGKPPWPDRRADTLRQIGYSDELPEYPTPITDDLRDFLDKCLKRDPSERWSCDQLLHHPFLLSCFSPSSPQITIKNCKSSPRCVFDWSDSPSSNESTLDIHQFDTKSSDAKQRIGKLGSSKGVFWETEGWEVVRHVTITTISEFPEHRETTTSVEEASVSGYTESTASYNYDHESTSKEARGTTAGWMYRKTVDRYSCCMFFVLIKKLLLIILLMLNFMQRIRYTQWFPSTPSLSSITGCYIIYN